MGGEMDLKAFIESTWFKGLARGAMLFGVPALMSLSGFVGYTLQSVQGAQTALRNDVTEIQRTQANRADVNDQFQAEITADVGGVKQSLFIVQTDVATIKGILQEMQRQSGNTRTSALELKPLATIE